MRIALASLSLALLSACATGPDANCGRACQLQAARDTAMGGALPASAKITENGAATSSDQAWLNGATSIAIHGEYADDEDAIVVGTGTGRDQKPAVFGLRIRGGRTPSEVELLVAHNGEASLFPPATPIARDPLFDAIVPPERRTPAAEMIAAANAYFDGIETDDGSRVPVTETCNRVENGVQTTRTARFVSAGCNSLEAFVYITEVRDRRYPVIDEERGVVVGFVAFNIPGGDYRRVINGQETVRHYDPRSLFLFEAFKVVDGKIEKIEATMRNVPLGAKTGW